MLNSAGRCSATWLQTGVLARPSAVRAQPRSRRPGAPRRCRRATRPCSRRRPACRRGRRRRARPRPCRPARRRTPRAACGLGPVLAEPPRLDAEHRPHRVADRAVELGVVEAGHAHAATRSANPRSASAGRRPLGRGAPPPCATHAAGTPDPVQRRARDRDPAGQAAPRASRPGRGGRPRTAAGRRPTAARGRRPAAAVIPVEHGQVGRDPARPARRRRPAARPPRRTGRATRAAGRGRRRARGAPTCCDECVTPLTESGSPAATSAPDVAGSADVLRPVRQRDDDRRRQLDARRRARRRRGDGRSSRATAGAGTASSDGVDVERLGFGRRAEHEQPAGRRSAQGAHGGAQPHLGAGGLASASSSTR